MNTFVRLIVFARNRAFSIGALSTVSYLLIIIIKGEDLNSIDGIMIVWLWISMLANKFLLADMLLEQINEIQNSK